MRIKNFNIFSLKSLLLESVMYSTSDLINLLYNIYYKENGAVSRIASIIREIIRDGDDIKTNYNALDLSPNKNDEILFIPDSQFQKAVSSSEDPWARNKSNTKVGRMIRQVLKDNGYAFVDKDIEQFVNAFKAYWDKKNGVHRKIEVVKGEQILHWYSNEQYQEKHKGTLGNSCMSAPGDNGYMEIYGANPDKISLVILTDENKLIARALLWNLDSSTQGKKILLDRIYTLNDSDVKFVYNWVRENIAKDDDSIFGHYDDDDTFGVVTVNLDHVNCEEYPYADTMYYLYKELDSESKLTGKGFLTNSGEHDVKEGFAKFSMNNTGGTISPISHIYVRRLDAWFHKNQCIELYGGGMWPKDMSKYSTSAGGYFPEEDLVWSENMKDWILKRHAIEDDEFGTILKDHLIKSVVSYEGNQTSPFAIASELIGEDSEKLFTWKRELRDRYGDGSDSFRVRLDNENYYFAKDLGVDDVYDDTMPEFLAMKAYKATELDEEEDLQIIERLPIYFEQYGHYYVTKQDATYYKISIEEEDPCVVSINQAKITPFYDRFTKNKSNLDVNEGYSKEYNDYIIKIHQFLLRVKNNYLDIYNSIEAFESIGDPTEVIVKSAIEGYKRWAIGIGDDTIIRYVDGRYATNGDETIEANKFFPMSNAIFMTENQQDWRFKESLMEYLYQYEENLPKGEKLSRIIKTCCSFASDQMKAYSSMRDRTQEEFSKIINEKNSIRNPSEIFDKALKMTDRKEVHKAIYNIVGPIYGTKEDKEL